MYETLLGNWPVDLDVLDKHSTCKPVTISHAGRLVGEPSGVSASPRETFKSSVMAPRHLIVPSIPSASVSQQAPSC